MSLAFLASAGACGAAPNLVSGNANGQAAAEQTGTSVSNEQRPIKQRFRNLDEYLAYLEKHHAPMDRPWYRQVRPGVYQLQTGNLRLLEEDGSEQQRTFTREELERKFGFSS